MASAPLPTLPSRPAMLRAFLASDPASEGRFIVAVKTTGIFCRPTCRARKPKPENVEFFPDCREALHGGFRPCKLCRPLDATREPPALIEKLRDLVEANPTGRLTEKALVAAGIDPSTARRQFQRHHGMTFQAYHRARRLGLALRDVQGGASVTDTQLARGFESASGFRQAFVRLFGEPPTDARTGTTRVLFAERIATPLGTLIAIADDAGLHVLDFVDRRGIERKLISLRTRLKCVVVPGAHPHLTAAAAQLAAYFKGDRLTFNLKLAPLGTAWEQDVWRALQAIPPGATRSYSGLATQLARAGAQRAVGRANGMNYLCIVIPCHRVIRSDGALCGYGGGLWRKEWLLAHEKKHAAQPER